jgi:DNA-binding CsgD family transcriptional regulator
VLVSAAGLTRLADLERLTTREAEVLERVACGPTNTAIAERLWIAPGTVKKHLEQHLREAHRNHPHRSGRPDQPHARSDLRRPISCRLVGVA